MTTPIVVALVALAFNLYLSALALARLRRVSAQMAVLTLRVTELVEMLDGLESE